MTTHPCPSATRNAALEEAAQCIDDGWGGALAGISFAIRALKTKLTPADTVRQEEILSDRDDILRCGIAELYQVVGVLADMAGVFNNPQVIKALDWAANPDTAPDLLPFGPAQPLAQSGWRTIDSCSELVRNAAAWSLPKLGELVYKLYMEGDGSLWAIQFDNPSTKPLRAYKLPSPPTVPPKE